MSKLYGKMGVKMNCAMNQMHSRGTPSDWVVQGRRLVKSALLKVTSCFYCGKNNRHLHEVNNSWQQRHSQISAFWISCPIRGIDRLSKVIATRYTGPRFTAPATHVRYTAAAHSAVSDVLRGRWTQHGPQYACTWLFCLGRYRFQTSYIKFEHNRKLKTKGDTYLTKPHYLIFGVF